MGTDTKEVLTYLVLSEDNKGKVKDALEEYYVPKANVIYERYVFRSATQQSRETFDAYFARLRKLMASCNYQALEEEMLRDNKVCGIQDDAVRARLLRNVDLKLQFTVDCCRASECATAQAKSMQAKEDAVHTC